LNPINHDPGDQQHVTVAELKALQEERKNDWAREPDRKFFLALIVIKLIKKSILAICSRLT
jgi:hypothetical protein